MSKSNAQAALIAHFQSQLGTLSIPPERIFWPNIAFTPPQDAKPWYQWHWMPAGEGIATLGTNGLDLANGLVQIDLCYPSGAGEGNSKQKIDLFRTCFTPGSYVYQGQHVTILSRTESAGFTRDNYYKIPFTIRWRAYLPR